MSLGFRPGPIQTRLYSNRRFYYPCSENKGADQLPSYREADLRLCFRICKRFSHNEAHITLLKLQFNR